MFLPVAVMMRSSNDSAASSANRAVAEGMRSAIDLMRRVIMSLVCCPIFGG
jgi:hypothetical protein